MPIITEKQSSDTRRHRWLPVVLIGGPLVLAFLIFIAPLAVRRPIYIGRFQVTAYIATPIQDVLGWSAWSEGDRGYYLAVPLGRLQYIWFCGKIPPPHPI